jgi:CHASE2 domain-containing sensor protein
MDTTATSWSTRNKVGLGLAIFYGLANVPSFLTAPDDGQEGPPLSILIVCSILGVMAVAAGIIAWRRRNRAAARLTAASVIVITLTSLPAFFVDVPAAIKALSALSVVYTVAAVVLMFSTSGHPSQRETEVAS